MGWIVEKGVVKIPDGVSYDRASFIEPVNTCVKAVDIAAPKRGDTVLVQGQGPIGLVFTMLLARIGVNVVATDTMPARLELARKFGAAESWDPRSTDVPARLKDLTQGRGADQVFSATSAKGLVDEAIHASRPGAKILLFAQTSAQERIEVCGADLCVGERMLYGSYSASVELQEESARLVLGGTSAWSRSLVRRSDPAISS